MALLYTWNTFDTIFVHLCAEVRQLVILRWCSRQGYLFAGNIMTLSYSLGLTTGSAAAYALDNLLEPTANGDPCMTFIPNITATTPFHLTQALFSTQSPA